MQPSAHYIYLSPQPIFSKALSSSSMAACHRSVSGQFAISSNVLGSSAVSTCTLFSPRTRNFLFLHSNFLELDVGMVLGDILAVHGISWMCIARGVGQFWGDMSVRGLPAALVQFLSLHPPLHSRLLRCASVQSHLGSGLLLSSLDSTLH